MIRILFLIEDLEKQAEAIRVEQIKLYESYADGVLRRDAYIEKKKTLSEKLAALQDSIRTEKEEQECADELDEEIRALTKQASEKTYIGGLTKECVDAFVSMVYLYADEILTREDFLNYNELYSKRIEEYDRKITELEAERQNLQTAPNAYPFLDVYRKYRKLEEITRPMVVELIEKIEVYEGNRVEITFRFQDEIADLLEELHQKQMGQREVSA